MPKAYTKTHLTREIVKANGYSKQKSKLTAESLLEITNERLTLAMMCCRRMNVQSKWMRLMSSMRKDRLPEIACTSLVFLFFINA